MIKKTRLKWFTILEMLIVLIIVWILAIVLTESYITISKTALRIEQEKNLSEESLILTQVFQAISDEATIDYSKYKEDELKNNNWYSEILYLTWWQREGTSIYTKADDEQKCLELEWNFKLNEDGSIQADNEWNIPNIQDFANCKLILEDKDGNKTVLNTSWKVVVSKAKFKIIPYDSDENYFSKYNAELKKDPWFIVNHIHQPAFWMFIHLYSPLYQPKWTNKVDLPLQLFFNLNL